MIRIEIYCRKNKFIIFDFGSVPDCGSLAIMIHRDGAHDLCSVYAGSDYGNFWDNNMDNYPSGIEKISMDSFDKIKKVLINWKEMIYQEMWQEMWDLLSEMFPKYIRLYGR